VVTTMLVAASGPATGNTRDHLSPGAWHKIGKMLQSAEAFPMKPGFSSAKVTQSCPDALEEAA